MDVDNRAKWWVTVLVGITLICMNMTDSSVAVALWWAVMIFTTLLIMSMDSRPSGPTRRQVIKRTLERVALKNKHRRSDGTLDKRYYIESQELSNKHLVEDGLPPIDGEELLRNLKNKNNEIISETLKKMDADMTAEEWFEDARKRRKGSYDHRGVAQSGEECEEVTSIFDD